MFEYSKADSSIYLYGVIGEDFMGEGITAAHVVKALDDMRDSRVTVYINSPGGQADEGIAIYNVLRRHKAGVDVVVDSLAASAASVIAMAGQSRKSLNGSRWMIHRALAVAIGNRDEMRAMARVLETYDESLAEIYSAALSMDRDAILSAMTRETWYTSEQALQAGLATTLEDSPATQPVMSATWFESQPEELKEQPVAQLRPVPAKRILAKLKL